MRGPHIQLVATFPSARLDLDETGLPVEVSLIAQLGHGVGDALWTQAQARQRAHEAFIDTLDEPSARIAGMHLDQGDATSLYTFAVAAQGHPFHRHAGHRVFTAISGSGGALLRFAYGDTESLVRNPDRFLSNLRQISIPPDCLFTVRFGGGTWHQFAPPTQPGEHPVLFALSCHTNELGGELDETTRQRILDNEANIPALTELLPDTVAARLATELATGWRVPTNTLSLDSRLATSPHATYRTVRSLLSKLRSRLGARHSASGFLAITNQPYAVTALPRLPPDSLLHKHWDDKVHHEDVCQIVLRDPTQLRMRASDLLAVLLEGFLQNRPQGVSRLMALRNWLVRPFRLRTSPLGCPVSSLLSDDRRLLFRRRYPVHAESVDADDRRAQVILGADDRHLRFRSCVGVRIVPGERIELTLATRVHSYNLGGHLYMAVIEHVHRHYASPLMLRMATEYALDVLVADSHGDGHTAWMRVMPRCAESHLRSNPGSR